jgi:hypothetical protein
MEVGDWVVYIGNFKNDYTGKSALITANLTGSNYILQFRDGNTHLCHISFTRKSINEYFKLINK